MSRHRHNNFRSDSDSDESIVCGYYQGYRNWSNDLSEKEIADARPMPFPKRLLDTLLGLKEDDAKKIVRASGYSVRIAPEYLYTYTLKRDRINLRLNEDKIVVQAFIG